MKKLFYTFVVIFFCITAVIAKTITADVAQTVAANFFQQNGQVPVKSLSQVYTATTAAGDAAYFVFNINASDGFVIVVADDAEYPIIGYSNEGIFVTPSPSSNFGYWMEQRKKEIAYNKAHNIQPNEEITSQWTAYANGVNVSKRTEGSLAPIVKTLWDQPAPYNADCPGGSVTGCVATAMAQIMRFWSYPAKGTGSSSYNSSYGTLSANYGSTTYNWANMPIGNVTSANADVATLMYDCGVSVDMEYSPSGSGAEVTTYDDPSVCAQISYSKYFGYDPGTIKGLQRFNYSDANWINLIQTDLNSNRPVQYVGFDPNAGGHTWVCDGYDASNNLHMNWGWSGQGNGYFSINLLNPGGYNFSAGHEVVVGIQPKSAVLNDAGILSVTSPTGTTCNPSITPVVRLENFGTSNLTSCTINYYYDSNTASKYNWTGSIAKGQYISVTLPVMSVTSGTHSFTSYTSKPNNVTDSMPGNDQSTGSFTIAANPPGLPVSEGFEGSSFFPTGWSLYNPDADAAWQIITTVHHTGTNCIGMNNCDGDGSTDMTGTKDRFITMPYDFSKVTNATLAFDVAYATCTFSGKLYTDTLVVYYSTDCGSTWTSVYAKGGTALSTSPTYDADNNYGCWSPGSTQWRTDLVSLNSLIGQTSVMFAFENRSGWGEWIFVDNINLSGAGVTGIRSIPAAETFRVYPNPANSIVTVEGTASGNKVHYILYNMVGQEMRTGDITNDGNHFVQTIEVSDLAKGMYFLRVNDNERSWTMKIDLQ